MKQPPALSHLITRKSLRKMADDTSFERGREYASDGRVSDLEVDENEISASVSGANNYRVKLWLEDGAIEYSCTCPYHRQEGAFCKHCVAVGLEFLDTEAEATGEQPRTRGRKHNSRPGMTLKQVQAYLETRDPAFLASLLVQHAKQDDVLKSRLLLEASKGSPGTNLDTFRRTIDRTLSAGEFVDYYSMDDYTQGIDQIVDSLDDLLKGGHATEAMELAEYLLKHLGDHMDMLDDSNGDMDGIMEKVQDTHHAACLAAKPDPEQLARKLYAWATTGDREVFLDAVSRYADALGEEGMKAFTKLAVDEWSKLPPLKPGQEDRSYTGKRFYVTYVMEQLARRSRDVERVVEVMSKDLSSPYSYLKIAETYASSRKNDKALEWAEKGLSVFPEDTNSGLLDFLAKEYHHRGRHDDAMQIAWKEFTGYTSLAGYEKLKKHAQQSGGSGTWEKWREKALAFIREEIAQKKTQHRRSTWDDPADNTLLVQIFVWENDAEAAWKEAIGGGCMDEQWLELAKLREPKHPEDALPIYQSRVEPAIRRMNNDAYHEAAAYMKKMKSILKRMGREEEWTKFLEKVKAKHKQKRNLMALLNTMQ